MVLAIIPAALLAALYFLVWLATPSAPDMVAHEVILWTEEVEAYLYSDVAEAEALWNDIIATDMRLHDELDALIEADVVDAAWCATIAAEHAYLDALDAIKLPKATMPLPAHMVRALRRRAETTGSRNFLMGGWGGIGMVRGV